jgi:hypothetical protein
MARLRAADRGDSGGALIPLLFGWRSSTVTDIQRACPVALPRYSIILPYGCGYACWSAGREDLPRLIWSGLRIGVLPEANRRRPIAWLPFLIARGGRASSGATV